MTNLTSVLDESSIKELITYYGTKITSSDIRGYCASRSLSYQTITKKLEPFKTSRGCWNLEVTPEQIESLEKSYNVPTEVLDSIKILDAEQDNLIPRKDPNFVAFGNFSDIKKVIKSNLFYPTLITGLSGNGKTFSVEQACAQFKREIIRVNITIETDADDLLGGFRMIAGETVWSNGPVVEAMQRGAILLLDECLDENQEVLVGTVDNYVSMKLSDMEFNKQYPVVSFNMKTGELENDSGFIISDKDDDIYEVELEDGRTIRLNSKHPFIVHNEDGTFSEKTISDGLSIGQNVVSFT